MAYSSDGGKDHRRDHGPAYGLASGRSKKIRYRMPLKHRHCPRPPLYPINRTVLRILDTSDILRLEAKRGAIMQEAGSHRVSHGRRMTPSGPRRAPECVSLVDKPSAGCRFRPYRRCFVSLYEAVSDGATMRGQVGRTNPARRAHHKEDRICVSAR